jgi:hypothetical protein
MVMMRTHALCRFKPKRTPANSHQALCSSMSTWRPAAQLCLPAHGEARSWHAGSHGRPPPREPEGARGGGARRGGGAGGGGRWHSGPRARAPRCEEAQVRGAIGAAQPTPSRTRIDPDRAPAGPPRTLPAGSRTAHRRARRAAPAPPFGLRRRRRAAAPGAAAAERRSRLGATRMSRPGLRVRRTGARLPTDSDGCSGWTRPLQPCRDAAARNGKRTRTGCAVATLGRPADRRCCTTWYVTESD